MTTSNELVFNCFGFQNSNKTDQTQYKENYFEFSGRKGDGTQRYLVQDISDMQREFYAILHSVMNNKIDETIY